MQLHGDAGTGQQELGCVLQEVAFRAEGFGIWERCSSCEQADRVAVITGKQSPKSRNTSNLHIS
jgi:hypothetical protein